MLSVAACAHEIEKKLRPLSLSAAFTDASRTQAASSSNCATDKRGEGL